MDLSVVVVNWNSGTCLLRLMHSMEPLLPEIQRVIIVDNNSRDGSLDHLLLDQKTLLVRFSRNRGFAAGSNEGISRASSGFVLLVNPDIVLIPEHVRRLYRYIQTEEKAAIVCGLLQDPDGTVQEDFQIRPLPTPWTVLTDALFLDELFSSLGYRPGGSLPEAAPPRRQVEQPAAAFWMLRTRAWEELGGFDEDFHPAWFEDVDFCKRLSKTGWKIFCYSDCLAYHFGGISLKTLGRAKFTSIYYSNLLKYLRKHHPHAFPFLWLPVKAGSWVRRIRSGA